MSNTRNKLVNFLEVFHCTTWLTVFFSVFQRFFRINFRKKLFVIYTNELNTVSEKRLPKNVLLYERNFPSTRFPNFHF